MRNICLCAVALMVLAAILSVLVLGISISFLLGLFIGTAVALINFALLAKANKMVLDERNPTIAIVGYFVRMLLYGAAFYLCLTRLGKGGGVASVIGFMMLYTSLFVVHGILPSFKRTKEPEASTEQSYQKPVAGKEVEEPSHQGEQKKEV